MNPHDSEMNSIDEQSALMFEDHLNATNNRQSEIVKPIKIVCGTHKGEAQSQQ